MIMTILQPITLIKYLNIHQCKIQGIVQRDFWLRIIRKEVISAHGLKYRPTNSRGISFRLRLCVVNIVFYLTFNLIFIICSYFLFADIQRFQTSCYQNASQKPNKRHSYFIQAQTRDFFSVFSSNELPIFICIIFQ